MFRTFNLKLFSKTLNKLIFCNSGIGDFKHIDILKECKNQGTCRSIVSAPWQEVEDPASLVDLWPTLAEASGLPKVPPCHMVECFCALFPRLPSHFLSSLDNCFIAEIIICPDSIPHLTVCQSS